MHELGIVIDVVKQIEEYSKTNNIKEVETLVLEIGELSGIVPSYIEDVYPIAIEQSFLKTMKLKIETTQGIGSCKNCDFIYNLIANNNICPKCSDNSFNVISGTDFLIKELHIKENT